MVYKVINRKTVLSLFDGWDETLIWSCLQGIMGNIYTTDLRKPTAAMAIVGDFAFFAGAASTELVSYKPDWCTQDFIIMVPQNKDWQNTIVNYYGNRAKIVSRYATKKEPDVFKKGLVLFLKELDV